MTQYQLFETLAFAAFALFALIGTWRAEGKRQVGLVLFACWVASNVTFWTMPVEYRPAVFPILDVLLALTAAKAGMELNSRVPLYLITLSIFAICINAGFSLTGNKDWSQLHFYETSLNFIFVLQCLITGVWGIWDAGWIDRIWRVFGGRRHRSQYFRRSTKE